MPTSVNSPSRLLTTPAAGGGCSWALAVIHGMPAVAAVSRPARTQPMTTLVIFAFLFRFVLVKVTPAHLIAGRTARRGPARQPVPSRARSAPARPVPARYRTGTGSWGHPAPQRRNPDPSGSDRAP